MSDRSLEFDRQIRPVLEEVRARLVAVLEATRPPLRSVADLRETLQLDQHLSWSLFSAASAATPHEIYDLLPGDRALGKFYSRASAWGAPAAVVERLRDAIQRLNELADRYAADRETFGTMVANVVASDQARALDQRHKRDLFRAAAALWGKQARQTIHCAIVQPSATPGMVDHATISGSVGVSQTRPGVKLRVGQVLYWAAADPAAPIPAFEPLEPAAPDKQLGLLPRFCSQPLPRFHAEKDAEGRLNIFVVPNSLGVPGETSYFFGHLERATDPIPGPDPKTALTQEYGFMSPVKLFVADILIHEDVWDDALPEVSGYQLLPPQAAFGRDAFPMPPRERVVLLGRGIEVARTPETPRHAEMLGYAFERLGWDPARFSTFRCRIEHPIINTRVQVVFDRSARQQPNR